MLREQYHLRRPQPRPHTFISTTPIKTPHHTASRARRIQDRVLTPYHKILHHHHSQIANSLCSLPFSPSPLLFSPTPAQPTPHIIVQGRGIQQHSKSPQSIHFVLPGSMPAGFKMEEAVVDGREKLTREVEEEEGFSE